MTPKEILIAARAKIEAPERWTQGEYARNKRGGCVDENSPSAACWCIVGAIGSVSMEQQHAAWGPLIAAIGGPANLHIPNWNDAPERTHAEVLAAFDRAIAAAGDA